MRSEKFIAQAGLGAALLVFIPCIVILLICSGSVTPSSAVHPTFAENARELARQSVVSPRLPQAVMTRTMSNALD